MGYYKLHTDVKAWHEALKVCEEEGAHLAVINSEDEAKALGPFWDMNPKILDGNANNWAHIGFHDLYKEGEYLTIFSKCLSNSLQTHRVLNNQSWIAEKGWSSSLGVVRGQTTAHSKNSCYEISHWRPLVNTVEKLWFSKKTANFLDS
jgi:hypothetical protein